MNINKYFFVKLFPKFYLTLSQVFIYRNFTEYLLNLPKIKNI